MTVSPNNPTGAVYPEAALRAVNALCRERGIFHVHDEAYEYFTYGGTAHFSPGSIDGAAPHTISLYSLSKAYGMASWRVGYMVIPEALWEAVNKIQDTLLICAPAISQQAALAALEVGAGYARAHSRASIACGSRFSRPCGDPAVPCDVAESRGAFYYFIRVRREMDPLRLVERLVREHRIAVIPGTAFGAADGCYLRVSYGALDAGTVSEGVTRLTAGLRATLVKIITWNVNGIRARHEQLDALLRPNQPDVICLQEIKAAPDQVPELLLAATGHWSLLARRRRLLRRRAPRSPQFFHGTTGVQSSVFRCGTSRRRRRPRSYPCCLGLRPKWREGLRRQAAVS